MREPERRCGLPDNKPAVIEYKYGGGCGGAASNEDPIATAIVSQIPGAQDLYAPQGRVTVRIENLPQSSGGSSSV
jgi:hypothetical protein